MPTKQKLDIKAIAGALEEVALLLELSNANPFRVRAFSNGARILKGTDQSIERFLEDARNKKIKGIGPALTEEITILHETGDLPFLQSLRKEFPEGLLELLKIPGLGAKKLKILYEEREITNLEELESACQNDSIANLKGFGKKTQENILIGIGRLRTYSGRSLVSVATEAAEEIIEELQKSTYVDTIEIAGSLRRKKETIGDIDLLATSQKPEKLMEVFTSFPDIEHITAHGETKSSVVLKTGVSVDLRVVSKKEFPAALQYFTGSKEHNISIRSIATKKGYKLNEYGLFQGEKPLSIASEKDIYAKLDLAFIPPELREERGELELAAQLFEAKKSFPKLLETKHLKGILHAHTTYSDGANTLEELATFVRNQGFEYLGVSDHSQSAAYAGGLKPPAIKKQHAEIDSLNQKLSPFRIFKGIESDILPDGSLDYSDDILQSFDFVVASVHSSFNMSEQEMTKRIIKAIANPFTTILGHPTGRLLLKREGYPIDVPSLLKAAALHSVVVEINAHPKRLDLDWRYHKRARELGVMLSINPDAHALDGVAHVGYGVGVARKGGLAKKDILNCMSLSKIEEFFSKD